MKRHLLACSTTLLLFLLIGDVWCGVDSGTKESEANDTASEEIQVYSMEIQTNISSRFATTLVKSKVRNPKNSSAETTFSLLLPEQAFTSRFIMEIEGKTYLAYVKEKSEAKQIYDKAVAAGQSAAHVQTARDSRLFTVSVNVPARTKAIFYLTYEELLKRENGHYSLVLNVNPGRILDLLTVHVHINETAPLKYVVTPNWRSGNEISSPLSKSAHDSLDDKLKPQAEITVNGTDASISFAPNKEKQLELATAFGGTKEGGVAGQFVVEYDVERPKNGSEILLHDGYFVHFFDAPEYVEVLPKRVVFVLDDSGSMAGVKFRQLTEAMTNILDQLNSADYFSMVRFSDKTEVWHEEGFVELKINNRSVYGHLADQLLSAELPRLKPVNEENVRKAKKAVASQSSYGLTNIIEGVEVGLFLLNHTSYDRSLSETHQPILIFLTDGQPNVGISSTEEIIKVVTNLNNISHIPIFSLSFGESADKRFLRKLSLSNYGFSRHIYEAGDSSLQLQEFYKLISSPLLSNVTFKYEDYAAEVTKTHYPIFFRGSEVVIAGRYPPQPHPPIMPRPHLPVLPPPHRPWCTIKSWTSRGTIVLQPPEPIRAISSLERLWAYLRIKQILDARDLSNDNSTKAELTKQALDLSLKYTFVTPVTSLVVVRPEENTNATGSPALESEGSVRRPVQNNYFAKSGGYPRYGPPPPAYPRYTGYSGSSSAYPHFGFGGGGIRYFARPHHASNIYNSFDHRPTFKPWYHFNTTSVNYTVPVVVPSWLVDLREKNGTINTPNGPLKVGKSGDVTTFPECTNNIHQNRTGECKIIFDCPQILRRTVNETVFLLNLCPLNGFAGVCCPRQKPHLTLRKNP